MKDGLLNNKNETSKIAEKYIKKYISDLQMHMNLSDSQIIEILIHIIIMITNQRSGIGYKKNEKQF